MRSIFDFVRTYLFILLSSVVSLVCLMLAFVAMSSTSVRDKMQASLREIGANEIAQLRRNPRNEAVIQAEKQRVEMFKKEYAKTMQVAHQISARRPLMDGVFPEVTDDANPLRFVAVYVKELQRLPRRMAGGTLPTPVEIAEEQQNVQDLIALEQEQEEEERVEEDRQPLARVSRPPRPVGRGALMPPGGRSSRLAGAALMPANRMERGLMPPGAARGLRPGGLRPTATDFRPPSQEPKYDPVFRARVAKALRIRCYVEELLPDINLSPSFHISPIVTQTANPPPEELWYAQVALWINEDVVQAIDRLNSEVARDVGVELANIEHVPVKRLVATPVFGYVLADGTLLPFPTLGGGPDRTVQSASFTGRKANSLYDVVPFRVVAVVSQPDVLRLIDEITKSNFYQCVGASYETVNRAEEEAQGYFYGTEPVVRVTLDFEGYLLRDVYKPLMPKSVKELLGIKDEKG